MHSEIISGTEGMARFLGISQKRLLKWMEENPDFPARKIGHNGAWLTTRNALMTWLDSYVTQREVPVREYPLPRPERLLSREKVEKHRPEPSAPNRPRRHREGAASPSETRERPLKQKRGGPFW